MIGKRFGKLIVVSLAKRRKRPEVRTFGRYWVVKCDCGVEKEIRASSLRLGSTRSCGCGQRNKLPNNESTINAFLASYKLGAKRRNLCWKISRQKFLNLIRGNCFYCDEAPSLRTPCGSQKDPIIINGIDRKNSKIGYTLENCVPCCTLCNRMKWDYSDFQFLEKVEKIHNRRTNLIQNTQFTTVTCDAECGKTATFEVIPNVGVANEVLEENPWLKTNIVVQLTDKRSFSLCSPACMVTAAAKGMFDPIEPKAIQPVTGGTAAIAAAAAAERRKQLADKNIREGAPARVSLS